MLKTGQTIAVVAGLACVLAQAAVSIAGESIVVAEYQTDGSEFSPGYGLRTSNFYLDTQDLDKPVDIDATTLEESMEVSWQFGNYSLSSIVNWAFRDYRWAGGDYGDEQSLVVGSKLSFGGNSETLVYHGRDRDQLTPYSYLYGREGESEAARTGLRQTLNFIDRQVSIRLGYEYQQSDREFRYQDREGHEVDLGGLFPIGWGFNAQVEAAYGRYSYGEYSGSQGGLDSSRTSLRAAISRSFTQTLSGGVHYSYVDEAFDTSDFSQTRQSWGLSLRYRY